MPPWEEDLARHPWVNRAVKKVSTDLFGRIVAGTYSFGTRLPSERELSTDFGESRNTIRQAIAFLETYRVVTRRGNAGTFVSACVAPPAERSTAREARYLDIKDIAERVSPFDMYVAQFGIEPEIARVATASMSMHDVATLRMRFAELEAAAGDSDRFMRAEQQFLASVCVSTRNSALIGMYAVLNEIRNLSHWSESRRRMLTNDNMRHVVGALGAVLHALERRRADNAAECMRHYLALAHEPVVDAM